MQYLGIIIFIIPQAVQQNQLNSRKKTGMAKFVGTVIQLCGRRVRTWHCTQTAVHDQSPARTLSSSARTLSTALCSNRHCSVLDTKPQAVARLCCDGRTVSSSRRMWVHTGSASLSPTTHPDNLTSEKLIEAWFNEVKTFGTLRVHDLPFDVHIRPLNPVDEPDGNKSLVKLFYDGGEGGGPLEGRRLSDLGKLCDLKVLVEEGGARVAVSCDVPSGVQLPLVCVITVPIKFGECCQRLYMFIYVCIMQSWVLPYLPVPLIHSSVTLVHVLSVLSHNKSDTLMHA